MQSWRRNSGPSAPARCCCVFVSFSGAVCASPWLMRDDFGRYLALGATIVVVVQGFINMSVVLGMMPTKASPCR